MAKKGESSWSIESWEYVGITYSVIKKKNQQHILMTKDQRGGGVSVLTNLFGLEGCYHTKFCTRKDEDNWLKGANQ